MRCILKNGVFLLWNNNGFILERRDALIDNHILCGWNEDTCVDKVYDLTGNTVVPSFFNIHCHLGEMFYREICKPNWNVEKYIESTEKENDQLTPKEREIRWNTSAVLTINELLFNGITGIAAGRSAIPCKKNFMFNMCGYPLMKSNKLKTFTPSMEKFQLYKRVYESERCKVGILLHSLYMTDEAMLNFARIATTTGIAEFFTAHISEDGETRNKEMMKYGEPPVNVLASFNLLTNKSILVHCGYTSQEELYLLAENGVIIAACPISNKFLSTCMPNLYLLEHLSIKWCIATDGPATGRTLSMTRQLACAKKQFPQISDEVFFLSITQRPGEVCDCPYYSGKIEIGTEASFNIINKMYGDAREVLSDLVQDTVSYRLHRF